MDSRQDLIMLGRLEEAVSSIKGDVSEIKKIVADQRTLCSEDMQLHNERILALENCHRGEQAVKTWREMIVSKYTAFIVFLIVVVSYVESHLPGAFDRL